MSYVEVAEQYNKKGFFRCGYVPFRVNIANAKTNQVWLELLEAWEFVDENGNKFDEFHFKIEDIDIVNGLPVIEKFPQKGIFQRDMAYLEALTKARKQAVETIKVFVCPSEPITVRQFLCPCGCTKFYRDPKIAKHCRSFYEGHFNCLKCGIEHNYCSSAFSKAETKLNKMGQIAMF